MTIASNYTNKEHIKKRKKSAMAAIADVKTLGFNKPSKNIGLKKLLFTTYIRSRLTYALENCQLKTSDLDEIESFEAKIIKNALGIRSNAYTTELFAAIGLHTFKQQHELRQIGFMAQLMENQATSKLVLNTENDNTNELLEKIGQIETLIDQTLDEIDKRISIYMACRIYRKTLYQQFDNLRTSQLSKATSYLLENLNNENRELIDIILNPQNNLRDIREAG